MPSDGNAPSPSGRVAILGAGFSRAVDAAMPTMLELGVEVLEALGQAPETLRSFDENLERWMSYLAVDQPWLSDAENLRNRSLFTEAAEAVADIIRRRESEAVGGQPLPPTWLIRLVWGWCDDEANVFTFNYDTLIERTIRSMARVATVGDVYSTSLEQRWPPGSSGWLSANEPRGPVMALHKLHGSTNWGFGGLGGPTNDRIVLQSQPQGWQDPATESAPPRYRPMYDDLAPLIVPPTFTKGPYYGNRALRGQWKRGADSLSAATELSIIGYSFPDGDLVAREWVSTSLAPTAVVTVVDRDPDVGQRISSALGRDVESVDGDGAIESYVGASCGDYIEWAIEEVDGDTPIRIRVKVNAATLSLDSPGGTDLEAAKRWVHSRVEFSDHGAVDRSVSLPREGLVREHNYVVLSTRATHGFDL